MSFKRLATAGYALAALLWIIPLIDIVANVWPLRPGDATWRYGSEGLLAGFLLTPFLGLALAAGLAAWRGEGGTLRLLGWLSGCAAGVLVVICGDFALNVLQVRSSIPAPAISRFDLGAAKAAAEYGLVVIGLAIWAFALIRTARAMLAGAPRSPLVVAREHPRKP